MPNPQSEEIFTHLEQQTQAYDLAVVFGSYARGEAYSASDLDLLLIDSRFSGWNLHEESQKHIEWPESLPELHLVTCSHDEFEERYNSGEDMVHQVAEDGFAVNKDFGLVDYLTTL